MAVSTVGLSAAELIDLAAEYGWNEDPATERSLLQAAAAMRPGIDAARARVLLAEAVLFTGDRTTATVLLDKARTQYPDPEIIAFADLVQGLMPLTPEDGGHGKRLYSDYDVMGKLCAVAADQWRGKFLGGWASIRLAALCRDPLGEPDRAAAILESTSRDYAGSPFGEYALEDLAAIVTFSLRGFGEGRERYEALLATTASDFIKQRATLHYGELLMDSHEDAGACELFSSFINAWPAHAATVGAYALRAYVEAEQSLWDEAASDADAYLAAGTASPAYVGKAHLVRGEVARARGDLDQAEREFLMVDDPFLIPSAKADLGYCRAARGDLGGAIASFVDASRSLIGDQSCAPFYLYQAGLLAQRLGDRAAFKRVLDTMIAEFPRHDLTSRLAGREVTPVPEI